MLTRWQENELAKALKRSRVKQHPYWGFNYLPWNDNVAKMNEIFGFCGWSRRLKSCELVSEEEYQKSEPGKSRPETKRRVIYKADVDVIIHGAGPSGEDVVYAGVGMAEEVVNAPNAYPHGPAAKAAVSDASKVAFMCLGTQFGITLKDKQGDTYGEARANYMSRRLQEKRAAAGYSLVEAEKIDSAPPAATPAATPAEPVAEEVITDKQDELVQVQAQAEPTADQPAPAPAQMKLPDGLTREQVNKAVLGCLKNYWALSTKGVAPADRSPEKNLPEACFSGLLIDGAGNRVKAIGKAPVEKLTDGCAYWLGRQAEDALAALARGRGEKS